MTTKVSGKQRKDRQRCKKTKTKNRHNDKLVTSSSHGDNRKFYLTTKLTDLYLLVLEKSQMKWITDSSFCNFESSEFVCSHICICLEGKLTMKGRMIFDDRANPKLNWINMRRVRWIVIIKLNHYHLHQKLNKSWVGSIIPFATEVYFLDVPVSHFLLREK